MSFEISSKCHYFSALYYFFNPYNIVTVLPVIQTFIQHLSMHLYPERVFALSVPLFDIQHICPMCVQGTKLQEYDL